MCRGAPGTKLHDGRIDNRLSFLRLVSTRAFLSPDASTFCNKTFVVLTILLASRIFIFVSDSVRILAYRSIMVDQLDPKEVSDIEEETSAVAVEEPTVDTDALLNAALEKDAFLNDETRDQILAETTTFKDLGVNEQLCEAAESLKWTRPSKIQVEAIPMALAGRDVIGLAETGSGKTGAFVIPILQTLLDAPSRFYALILTPTRELAFQINEQVRALGAAFGVSSVTIVGGMDMTTQSMALGKSPHIIIATPGRLVDHLENTKGFNLKNLKYLVLDEADRILNLDFEKELDTILKVCCLCVDHQT